MEMNRPIREVPRGAPMPVVAIGNFDGVHLGHRAVIEQALRLGSPVGVLTFEPHPRSFLFPHKKVMRLTDEASKRRKLLGLGIDFVEVLRFDRAMASMSAADFIERILVEGLQVRAVVIGSGFRFGQGREGSTEMLHAYGQKWQFEVHVVPPVGSCERISSTAIRRHVSLGEWHEASVLLGYQFGPEQVGG